MIISPILLNIQPTTYVNLQMTFSCRVLYSRTQRLIKYMG